MPIFCFLHYNWVLLLCARSTKHWAAFILITPCRRPHSTLYVSKRTMCKRPHHRFSSLSRLQFNLNSNRVPVADTFRSNLGARSRTQIAFLIPCFLLIFSVVRTVGDASQAASSHTQKQFVIVEYLLFGKHVFLPLSKFSECESFIGVASQIRVVADTHSRSHNMID